MNKIFLHMGALCNSLSQQIEEQGLSIEPKAIDHFQQDADAITRLAVRQLITGSQALQARKKLIKKITKEVFVKESEVKSQ